MLSPCRNWTSWERYNVQADHLAIVALDAVEAGRETSISHLHTDQAPGYMFLGEEILASLNRTSIIKQLFWVSVQSWMCDCFGYTAKVFKAIHWDWIDQVQRHNTLGMKRWLYKAANK